MNLTLIIHRLKPVAIENIVSKLDNKLPPALAGGSVFKRTYLALAKTLKLQHFD
ncbi:hypothetical protein MCERE19_00393 [Spirosomataceae bacterium]